MNRALATGFVFLSFLAACGKVERNGSSLKSSMYGVVDPARNAQALNILKVNCAGCHSWATDVPTMISSGRIKPGNAAGSPLMNMISSGSMPPSGKLAAADEQTLTDWINIDLANTSTQTNTNTNTNTNTTTKTNTNTSTSTTTTTSTSTSTSTNTNTNTNTQTQTSTETNTNTQTNTSTSTTTTTSTTTSTSTSTGTGNITYYQNIQPIIDAKCAVCHQTGIVDEVVLDSYDHVVANLALVNDAVTNKKMPPGQSTADASPLVSRNGYLSADERNAILSWISNGAPAGTPPQVQPAIPAPATLPRVDATAKLTSPYTPIAGDDYEDFTVPWPVQKDSYITGFEVYPGPDVHHILLYTDSGVNSGKKSFLQVGEYNILGFKSLIPYIPQIIINALTNPSSGGLSGLLGGGSTPAASTTTGPTAHNSDVGALASLKLVGAFVPGIGAQVFYPGIGIKILKGSNLVFKMHYNSTHNPNGQPSGPDQTGMGFMLADTVNKEAKVVPLVNPVWMMIPSTMTIPAGSANTGYSAVVDPFKLFSDYKSSSSLQVYSAIAHMHLHGKAAQVNFVTKKQRTTILNVPQYNFHFQKDYQFAKPVTLKKGQSIEGACWWDNSQAGQPLINGQPTPMVDLMWGEKTTDEMCLFGVYVTP